MDYQTQYNKLIDVAKTQTLLGYSEVHHIKPAALCRFSTRYGERQTFVWDMDADESSNLVSLTARQHYIAHLLLARIYPQMIPTIVRWKDRAKNSRVFETLMINLSTYRSQQYKDGTHNFCGLNEKRIVEGTHNFLMRVDGSSLSGEVQQNRLANGTHPFQGEHGSALAITRNQQMIKKGTHISVNNEAKAKFSKTRNDRINNGNWHTCGVRPWDNNSTKEYPRYIYSQAQVMFTLWDANKTFGSRKIATILNMEWSSTHDRLIKMFRDGWVPSLDTEWVIFKQSFDGE